MYLATFGRVTGYHPKQLRQIFGIAHDLVMTKIWQGKMGLKPNMPMAMPYPVNCFRFNN
jgi:hypothetical protein